MVSTRGVRYKFSEGERVLCYEPDPTKAKVLYDSKVLEVIESKDKRGRRMVEYLIHFQGWNSSWDRCVSEDFVLKDTEENRQLQRDLAEKSQLQLGAYLYRRERKKGGPVAAKRPRQGFSDDGSSTSTQPDAETAGDTDSSLGSSGSQVSEPPPQPHPGRAQITLPPPLRDRLTFDYHLISKRGRLSVLPSSPSVAEILESFVKWFARSGAWRPPDPPNKPNMLDVCCRLNLVREVADGLRVYFDFILRDHLLYKQEAEQYQEVCGQHMDREEELAAAQCEKESSDADTAERETASLPLATVEDDIKSPKIPEYAHLPPDPVLDAKSNSSRSTPEALNNDKGDSSDKDTADRQSQDENSNDKAKEERGTRSATVARRLRSHKSIVSQPETEEPAPSTSGCEPNKNDTMSSSMGSSGGSSISSGWGARVTSKPAPPPTPRTALSLLLDKVAKWQIIPREGTEHLPCRVYGAIHLARLFVKLPDFLNATHMSDIKLKMVLKHIDMFVQFLDEHNEWFGEMYYLAADSNSRSH